MRYAFIDANSIVVTIITGALTADEQQRFLDDYHVLFGAVAMLDVPDGVEVRQGDRYDSSLGFLPPEPPATETEI